LLFIEDQQTIGAMETRLLYYRDSYLREFASEVIAVDEQEHAVALAETAFFPTGGGQPHDTGILAVGERMLAVVDVRKTEGVVLHRLAGGEALPAVGEIAHGTIDWNRRYLLMRTHTAQHLLMASFGATMAPTSPGRT
jgi:misacylated tRNA(Ala) deacylase